jgi:hypothetical protein
VCVHSSIVGGLLCCWPCHVCTDGSAAAGKAASDLGSAWERPQTCSWKTCAVPSAGAPRHDHGGGAAPQPAVALHLWLPRQPGADHSADLLTLSFSFSAFEVQPSTCDCAAAQAANSQYLHCLGSVQAEDGPSCSLHCLHALILVVFSCRSRYKFVNCSARWTSGEASFDCRRCVLHVGL